MVGLVLYDSFPDIYRIQSFKDCKISDRLSNSSSGAKNRTMWCWRRSLRRGKEFVQLVGLCRKIKHVRLTLTLDSWSFQDSANRYFSVSTLRRYMADFYSGGIDFSFNWTKLDPDESELFCLETVA